MSKKSPEGYGKAASFESPEAMVEHADTQFQIDKIKINQAEIDKGFDINDIESILKFDIGYTPLQNSVVLKEIPGATKTTMGALSLIDLSNTSKKYFVIAFGLLVTTLKKGDIVCLGVGQNGNVQAIRKTFKDVMFSQVSYYDLDGVYIGYDEIVQRVYDNDVKAKQRDKEIYDKAYGKNGNIVFTSGAKEG